MTNRQDLPIKMALDAWNIQIGRADKLFESLTDEQLRQEVSPNRNSGIYLLGHLTAVHDAVLPLLGLGNRLYPFLDPAFVDNPDKSPHEKPPASDLRRYWKDVNAALAAHFNSMRAEEWFQKHNAVSAEDFEKEPHRNKLNVVLNRTGHLAYHLGQLAFLKTAL